MGLWEDFKHNYPRADLSKFRTVKLDDKWWLEWRDVWTWHYIANDDHPSPFNQSITIKFSTKIKT